MEREDKVRLGKFRIESSAKHGLCAAHCFFGRLTNQNNGAAPAIPELSEHARCAEKNCHVQVVAAGVHHADFAAAGARHFYVASVREAGIFNDWQCVHVRSNVNDWAGAIFQDSDDPVGSQTGIGVLAEMIGDFVAGFSEVRGDQRRSFFFLRGEFGIFVEVFVGSQERVGFSVDVLVQIVLGEDRHGDAECGGERKHAGTDCKTHRITSKRKRHLSIGWRRR